MRIAFFGTPQFAARVLHYLLKNDMEICAIITRTDKPKGRSGKPQPTAVKEVALKEAPDIPLYQPEKASDPEFVATLKLHKPDLCIVVAYGEIIKQNLLDLPKHGCINIHASLLPEYRGAAPIQRAIMDGKKESGVSIMEMVKKLDAGDVISTAKTRISEDMNFGQLHDKLCDLSGPLLMDVIEKFARGTVQAEPQNEERVTYAHKINQVECRIDWRNSADGVHNLVRGVSPFPGAWCEVEINGAVKRMKIFSTKVDYSICGCPGETIRMDCGQWHVACGDGGVQLIEIQLEGKKRMLVQEFARGNILINNLH
jgi:methionyl-tRNA formyltransferase